MISRLAGLSLHCFARVGTRDATNSFKAYSTDFVREVGIDSRDGFEIGLELIAKATRLRLPVAEIPTIWLERRPACRTSSWRRGCRIPALVPLRVRPQLTLDDLRRRVQVRRTRADGEPCG